MTRTVINIDDELLDQASEIFGTRTKVATVNAALKEAVDRRKRRELFDWIADGGLPDFGDEELTELAWQ